MRRKTVAPRRCPRLTRGHRLAPPLAAHDTPQKLAWPFSLPPVPAPLPPVPSPTAVAGSSSDFRAANVGVNPGDGDDQRRHHDPSPRQERTAETCGEGVLVDHRGQMPAQPG